MTKESNIAKKPTASEIEAARKQWMNDSFQACNKYLAEKGILTSKVLVEQSRYLAPIVALWKVKAQDGSLIWVITGKVPSDHVAASISSDPREILRHFSLTWQMKAQNIIDLNSNDKVQNDFAQLLIKRAEGLYELFEDDRLWQ